MFWKKSKNCTYCICVVVDLYLLAMLLLCFSFRKSSNTIT